MTPKAGPISLILLATVAVSSFSFAATPKDACALVTQPQVSAALEAPVGAGTHVTPTFLKTCTWTTSGNVAHYVVTVSLQPGASFAGTKSMTQEMTAGSKGASTTTASGIGDDAFYTSMGSGYTALLVKKGEVAFKVAVYGHLPAPKVQAVEKKLAMDVVSNLH